MPSDNKDNGALAVLGCLLIAPIAIVMIPVLLPLIVPMALIGLAALGFKLLGWDKN